MRLAVALMLALLGAGVHADAAPAGGADEARELYRLGQARFQAGQLEAAIDAFRRGYALDPRPEFLLNLAQSYRALGRRDDAIAHLRRFIAAAPDHPLRAAAEQTLAELERAAGPAPATQPVVPPPREVAPPVTAAPAPLVAAPPARRPASSRNVWPWLAGGAVVAAVGVAIFFATRAGPDEPIDTIVVPGP